jgi:hypothetical protein
VVWQEDGNLVVRHTTDQNITAQIRKSIMADKTLSTYAGWNGHFGPVRSDDEVKTIVAKATEVTGSGDRVVNQLEVKPPKMK